MKIHKKLLFTLAALTFVTTANSVLACAACFGKSDSAMAKGMNAGIFALLAVLGTVLTAATSFFVFLSRRAAAAAKTDAAANP